MGMYPILCEDLVRGGDWWVAVDVRLRKNPTKKRTTRTMTAEKMKIMMKTPTKATRNEGLVSEE